LTLFESIILGIIQGLTEFLPVSSSGHLAIAGHLFGIQTEGDLGFEIAVHGGTLLTVLIFFRAKLLEIARGMLTGDKSALRWGLFLVVATIPAALIGIPFKDTIAGLFNNPVGIGFAWIVMSVVLIFSERLSRPIYSVGQIGIGKVLLIGTAQAIALLPGISRSGSTISAGLLVGLKKKDAVEFAFLLSIPAVGGAILLQSVDWLSGSAVFEMTYLAGGISAGLSGYFAVAVMMRVVNSGKLVWFGIYCALIGVATLVANYLNPSLFMGQ